MFNKIPTVGSPVYGNILAALFLPFFTSAMDLCQRLVKRTLVSFSVRLTTAEALMRHCGEGWGGTVAWGGVM